VRQQFQRGVIVAPSGGVGAVLSGEIGAYWSAGKNSALLGSVTGQATALIAAGVTGLSQVFERGIVLSSTATGTYAILSGPIRTLWSSGGSASGPLGWPTSAQESIAGGVTQKFSGGTLTVSSDGTPISLIGSVYTYWSSSSNSSTLGRPIASAVDWSAGGVSGSYQVFERALVMSSSATGTFAVLDGAIRSAWGNLNGSRGQLGWPTGDQQEVPEGVRQQFQGGSVVVPLSGAPYVTQN